MLVVKKFGALKAAFYCLVEAQKGSESTDCEQVDKWFLFGPLGAILNISLRLQISALSYLS